MEIDYTKNRDMMGNTVYLGDEVAFIVPGINNLYPRISIGEVKSMCNDNKGRCLLNIRDSDDNGGMLPPSDIVVVNT